MKNGFIDLFFSDYIFFIFYICAKMTKRKGEEGENPMNDTENLEKIIRILRNKLVLIISLTVFFMIVAGVISFYVLSPVYQSTAQILVSHSQGGETGLDSQNLQTDLQLINTYNEIIKSPFILDKVVERLGMTDSVEGLNEKISVGSASESQVMNITVRYEDPAMAVKLANTTATVFQSEIRNLLEVNNVSILSPAILKDSPVPVEPNPLLNIAIAAVLGGMFSVGLAFLLAYMDTTINNEQDIEEVLGVPVLAMISTVDKKAKVNELSQVVLNEKEV